jgi:hypothetical protein
VRSIFLGIVDGFSLQPVRDGCDFVGRMSDSVICHFKLWTGIRLQYANYELLSYCTNKEKKMRNQLINIITLFFLIFTLSVNAADIYFHNAKKPGEAKKPGFEETIRKLVEDQEKTVIFGDTDSHFKNTRGEKVNWIIYVGHGSSCTGKIAPGNGQPWVSPIDLINNKYWKVKGVMIFGCAIIDIGDFGLQHSVDGSDTDICDQDKGANKGKQGNYCSNYFNAHATCDKPEVPDPGLKWEKLARANGISYILGFNFKAPVVYEVDEKGKVKDERGDTAIYAFLDKWFTKGFDNPVNFREAWKENITSGISSGKLIERGYITIGSDSSYLYSMGRANNLGGNKIIWPEKWKYQPQWKDLPKMPKQVNGMMSIEHYRTGCYFGDIPNTAWYRKHVIELCEAGVIAKPRIEGVIEGVSERLFRPSDNITRAEFVKMLMVSLKGLKECTSNPWHKCYVNAAKAYNIMGNEKPRPTEKINRAEIAKMVVVAKGFEKNQCTTDPFSDVSQKEWYCPFVLAVKNNGIIDGYNDKRFKPGKYANRAEAATILNNARKSK